jgi:hypothetical protein
MNECAKIKRYEKNLENFYEIEKIEIENQKTKTEKRKRKK